MKTLIVTGGLGFIGSNLVHFLLNKKYRVINIDNCSYSSNRYNEKDIKNNKFYSFIKCDLVNRKKIINILKKYNPIGIFNLAAQTHVDRSIDNAELFIKSNILGTYNLLEAILSYKKKIKLIHISTDEVFGDIKKGKSKENSIYLPNNPYAASKASADHLVRSYIKTFKINAVITNCSNNYGPNQNPEKFIPKIIFCLLNNKPIPVYAKGLNVREWIFVKDHCEGLYKVFLKGKTGEKYNISSGILKKNIDIVRTLIKIAKNRLKYKSKIVFVKDRPAHDFRYALNSEKMKKKLNWRAKTNINKGLNATFEWYLENPQFYMTVKNKKFFNRLGKSR